MVTVPVLAETPKPVVIRFGVQTFDRPSKTVVMYRPFLAHIERELKKVLHRPVIVRMMVSSDIEENIHRLSKGHVDFMAVDPAFYLDAQRRNPRLKIIAAEKVNGDTRFDMSFVTLKNSGLSSVADLRGRKVAFGLQASTCGRLIPQKELLWNGIHGRDLAAVDYVGRAERVRSDLLRRRHDVGILPKAAFAGDDRFAELATFRCPTNVWATRSEFPEDVWAPLHDILLSVDTKLPALKPMGVTGFAPETEAQLMDVREAMAVNWTGY